MVFAVWIRAVIRSILPALKMRLLPGYLTVFALVVCWIGLCGHGTCASFVSQSVHEESADCYDVSAQRDGDDEGTTSEVDEASCHRCPCDSLKIFTAQSPDVNTALFLRLPAATSGGDRVRKPPHFRIFQPPKLSV